MRLSAHSLEPAAPSPSTGRGPRSQHRAGTPGQLPRVQGGCVRRRCHLGGHAAVPGPPSPSRALPGEAGTITPPPNQIRPGSASADGGLWGGGLRVRNCSLSTPRVGHRISPCGARPGHAGSVAASSALGARRAGRPAHPSPQLRPRQTPGPRYGFPPPCRDT